MHQKQMLNQMPNQNLNSDIQYKLMLQKRKDLDNVHANFKLPSSMTSKNKSKPRYRLFNLGEQTKSQPSLNLAANKPGRSSANTNMIQNKQNL